MSIPNCDKIHEPLVHRLECDTRCSDLTASINDGLLQQRRIHWPRRKRSTHGFLHLSCGDLHQTYRAPCSSSSDDGSFYLSQQSLERLNVCKRIFVMPSVNQCNPYNLSIRRALTVVIRRRLGLPQRLCVSRHQKPMAGLNHFLALSKPNLVSADSKKSCSELSWVFSVWSLTRSAFCSPFACTFFKRPRGDLPVRAAPLFGLWISCFGASSARVFHPVSPSISLVP